MMRTATACTAFLLGIGLTGRADAGPAAKGASAKGTFEGDIQMQVTTDRTQGPQPVGVEIKGGRVRYELPPSSNPEHHPLQAIVDMPGHRILLVMPDQRTYAVLDMNQVPPQSKQATERKVAAAATDWTAAPTGDSRTVAGYACDMWEATRRTSRDKIDACLAPQVRIDFDSILPSSMLPRSWADALKNGELPLSATVYGADGNPTFNEVVTAVRARTPPDSDFEPPAGYKEVRLPLSAFGDLIPSTK